MDHQMKTRFIQTLLGGALLAAMLAFTGCASLPDDGANAQAKRFDNLNQVRYLEVFVVGGNGLTHNLYGRCYNTTFAPSFDLAASKDSAPQAYAEGIDLKAIKKQQGALGATLNGPKQWMLDWTEISLGKERDFNGKLIPWCADLNLKGVDLKKWGKVPYEPMTIARNSACGWNKGTTALLLDDPEGNTWVMKGFQVGLKPQYTHEQFVAAGQGQFKNLPPGWKFRVKTLDQDLIEKPEAGVATIMPDEFFNVYDKCGAGMTNYKP
jgi:hypothetical protein